MVESLRYWWNKPFIKGRVGFVLFVIGVLVWLLGPGLPVMRGPTASDAAKVAGRTLFEHEWTVRDALASGDGLGPVYNATSCVGCHNQGGAGGGGANSANVVSYFVTPNRRDKQSAAGLIHKAAIAETYAETEAMVHAMYPIVPNTQYRDRGCVYTLPAFDPVRVEQINTPPLFGLGWLDRVSSQSIKANLRSKVWRNIKEGFDAGATQVPEGRVRYLSDGRVGRFGWKAQFATLEEFTAAACANELGLGNPLMDQATPMGRQPTKASGQDITRRQFNNLVAFVDTLDRPRQVLPEDEAAREDVAQGAALFRDIGCAGCHTPDIGGVTGVYSDFLLHRIVAPSSAGYGIEVVVDEPVFTGEPDVDEWKTPPLWGVADSAPYMHNGAASTLTRAINLHGGSAAGVLNAYRRLPYARKAQILAFLNSLKAPTPGDVKSATVASAE
ncbi:MAG: c-type cytochrome [Phycisphaera sp.]|nr:c-type cytochrome [Phycisphaera sp.]